MEALNGTFSSPSDAHTEFFLRCDIPVVYKLQCIISVNKVINTTKYLIRQRRWDAIDNYVFRPSGGLHQVVHSEVDT